MPTCRASLEVKDHTKGAHLLPSTCSLLFPSLPFPALRGNPSSSRSSPRPPSSSPSNRRHLEPPRSKPSPPIPPPHPPLAPLPRNRTRRAGADAIVLALPHRGRVFPITAVADDSPSLEFPGTSRRCHHVRLVVLSTSATGIERRRQESTAPSATSPLLLELRRERIRRRLPPSGHPDLTILPVVSLQCRRTLSPSPLARRRSPAVTAASLWPCAGLAPSLGRPKGRRPLALARPSARPGPAPRPVGSGQRPAWTPVWAGTEAGLFCHTPGLQTGLGRPVGRPK